MIEMLQLASHPIIVQPLFFVLFFVFYFFLFLSFFFDEIGNAYSVSFVQGFYRLMCLKVSPGVDHHDILRVLEFEEICQFQLTSVG